MECGAVDITCGSKIYIQYVHVRSLSQKAQVFKEMADFLNHLRHCISNEKGGTPYTDY